MMNGGLTPIDRRRLSLDLLLRAGWLLSKSSQNFTY